MVYPSVLGKLFKKWCTDSNIDGISPHSARHAFASKLFQDGINPEVLRKLTGHADLTTLLDVYCYDDSVNPKDIKKAVVALDNFLPRLSA